MNDDLTDLYQEVILEHAKSPRNFKVLPDREELRRELELTLQIAEDRAHSEKD